MNIVAKSYGTDLMSILSLLTKKQKDYGHANILAFGPVGVVVRVTDKLARLHNLVDSGRDPAVIGESLQDTLMDLVGYAVIMDMLVNDRFNLPLSGK
jgi:hypothetical protein